MHKALLFVFMGLLLNTGVARAEDDKNRKEERTTELRCQFVGESNKGKGKGDKHFCTAFARICDDDKRRGDDFTIENELDRRERCRNYFTVICDGETIYRDGAYHSSHHGYDFIRGIPGDDPILKYLSEDDHHHVMDGRGSHGDEYVTSAWLNVKGTVLQGSCEVEKDDHRH